MMTSFKTGSIAAAAAAAAGLSLLLIGGGGAILTGCGGGGNTPGVEDTGARRGQAVVTVHWPERSADSRLLPARANSIRVAFLNAQNQEVQAQLLVRPDPAEPMVTRAVFTDLPAGDYTLRAVAFPNTDGSGVAQAQAAQPIAIVPGQRVTPTLTMATTIASLDLQPTQIPELLVGQPVLLTATARDAQGNTVLSTAYQWTSTDPSVFQVTPLGPGSSLANLVFQGGAPGTYTVTVRETESGLQRELQLFIPGGG